MTQATNNKALIGRLLNGAFFTLKFLESEYPRSRLSAQFNVYTQTLPFPHAGPAINNKPFDNDYFMQS